jgi:hypothetical protein
MGQPFVQVDDLGALIGIRFHVLQYLLVRKHLLERISLQDDIFPFSAERGIFALLGVVFVLAIRLGNGFTCYAIPGVQAGKTRRLSRVSRF